MSKRSRRTKKQEVRYSEFSSDSEDSDAMGWTELISNALTSLSNKKRKSVSNASKSKSAKVSKGVNKQYNASNNSTAPNNINKSSQSSKNQSGTICITVDDEVEIEDQSKKVEDKVEAFFRAHNLISDDEDNIEDKTRCPPKGTKEFYELSDSEDNCSVIHTQSKLKDEELSVKLNGDKEQLVCKSDTNIDEKNEHEKEDELMDVVDKILEIGDNPIDTQKDHSWTDYKSKTEEILGNITSLLSEISSSSKSQPTNPPKVMSPVPPKPACPVCLESLGGEIAVMTTTCGHIFCKPCIQKVAKSIKKCPTCRKNVNLKKIHPIYL